MVLGVGIVEELSAVMASIVPMQAGVAGGALAPVFELIQLVCLPSVYKRELAVVATRITVQSRKRNSPFLGDVGQSEKFEGTRQIDPRLQKWLQ